MSCLLGMLRFSLKCQSRILPIPIFLFRSIRLLFVWTRLGRIIKIRQMPLLVPDLFLKHSKFRLPFSIVAPPSWIGLSSWLGGLLSSIYVAEFLKELVLLIIDQRLPIIWVIVAILRGKCDTFGTTGIVGDCYRNSQWLPVVCSRLFHKFLVQCDALVKILT